MGRVLQRHREGLDSEGAPQEERVYAFDSPIAKEKKLRTPSLADAIVYAIALLKNDKLVTGDKLFKGLEAVIYIGD